jgi:DNA-binding NarL/FixJ family response regulator
MASRILIADDNSFIRKQIRIILESDLEVEVCAEAADGLEAVQKAQECHPDVAVMDFQMPEMDGLQATRELKMRIPTLPILIFALDASPELERASKQAGADAMLPKSEGGTRLVGVVQSLVRRQ